MVASMCYIVEALTTNRGISGWGGNGSGRDIFVGFSGFDRRTQETFLSSTVEIWKAHEGSAF